MIKRINLLVFGTMFFVCHALGATDCIFPSSDELTSLIKTGSFKTGGMKYVLKDGIWIEGKKYSVNDLKDEAKSIEGDNLEKGFQVASSSGEVKRIDKKTCSYENFGILSLFENQKHPLRGKIISFVLKEKKE